MEKEQVLACRTVDNGFFFPSNERRGGRVSKSFLACVPSDYVGGVSVLLEIVFTLGEYFVILLFYYCERRIL